MPSDSPQVISDLDIRDEFASLAPEASLREIAKILAKNEVKVILLVDKTKREVVGIITEQRFLQACATGADPESTVAYDYMSTNILRLLGDTPLQAARNLIDEKEPDAVIALAGDRKFRGYLSPEDYRHLRNLTKGAPSPTLKEPTVVSELQIRDEFASLGTDATIQDVAKILAKNEVKVILVVDRGKREVIGVITEQRFLQICATGIDPEVTLIYEYMQTDILRLLDKTPLQSARDLIEEIDPDAVIVLNSKRRFYGYLSPEDYRQLISLTKDPAQLVPAKPIKDGIITITEEEISSHITNHFSDGQGGSVIWSEGDSELVIHSDTIGVELNKGFARFTIDMECDQSPRTTILVRYFIGPVDVLDNLDASCESTPDGPPEMIGRWGRRLQDSLWAGLLDTIRQVMHGHSGLAPLGIGTADHLLHIGTTEKPKRPAPPNHKPTSPPPRKAPMPAGGGRK